MGTNDRTIDNQVLHVRVSYEVGMHLFPDAFVAPTSKALVHAIPFAVLLR